MKESIESWRVFIAVELPADVRKRIVKHIDHLRDSVPEARASWSREENLHLTVKFLGDISLARVSTLSEAAHRAARAVDHFELIIQGCGTFPPRGHPRVLWIGIQDPSGMLARLHRALEDESEKAGFAREARPFHPHLTVARLRKPQGSRRLAAAHKEFSFASQTVNASAVAVIRSELRSEGSKHTVISRHEFNS